ncbi:unnamed protein product [Rotaria magnacalcarata]|uniref:Uncharacterized protein n=1 Tax=Rotaria magnacalcarata TaxID=392030 RepID=A0A8S2Q891_9BILA|nr:unnamed protein product [Rotaria magnacalcarata]
METNDIINRYPLIFDRCSIDFLIIQLHHILSRDSLIKQLHISIRLQWILEIGSVHKHLQFVHNGQSDFKVRCELGPLCGNTYSTFTGYKTHIYREHTDLLDNASCKQEILIDTNTRDNETAIATSYDAQLDADNLMHNVEDERDQIESEIDDDDEDVICWPLLTEKTIQSSENKIDFDYFEKFYVDFLLNLREGHSLPQNIIQTTTSGLKSLIELVHELLKNENKNSRAKYQRSTTTSATDDSILLTDMKKVISNVIIAMHK